MSKLHLNRLTPLLTGFQSTTGIQSLLRNIVVLQAKLANPSGQDFYFQKGLDSHQRHLDEMKAEYAEMVSIANGNTLDDLLAQIKELEEKAQKICSPESTHPIFVKTMVQASSKAQISYLQDLVSAKGTFGTLKPLEELLKDEATLLRIFEL